MTLDLVTDRTGAVEEAAQAAFEESLALATRLGGAAAGVEGSAVSLGLTALIGEALALGLRSRLPDDPQVQGMAVKIDEIPDASVDLQ